MSEPYYVTVARVKREMRTHSNMAQEVWLKKQRNNPPRTEAERHAAAMSEPYNEGADITRQATRLWSIRRQLGDSE
jgi:hypothetical protein